jgi:large subunit ribosomal protein L28
VEPLGFEVEVAEGSDGAATQQAGLNKPAWLHRGLGFLAGVAGLMLIAAVLFPSPSHTESPSGFSLASFTPAAMPAMRGTNAAATSAGQTPVMQMSSPMQRSARIPTVPLRNTPPAMQMSSTAFDPLGLEPSEASQATTFYAVPSSHINSMQPGQNSVNSDSGVSVSTLGWLSILAFSTAAAYMAGKKSHADPPVKMSAAAATLATSTSPNPTAPHTSAVTIVSLSQVPEQPVTHRDHETAAASAATPLPRAAVLMRPAVTPRTTVTMHHASHAAALMRPVVKPRTSVTQMRRICDVTGKKANNANTVTFSNKKNARLQHVNLQKKRFFSPELGRNVRLKVATSTMRTITKLGLDETAKKYGCDLSKF